MAIIQSIISRLRNRVQGHFQNSELVFLNKSYSQEGEDRVLFRIFEAKIKPGFYIDVGAHHPLRFSNTYLFYQMGWRGLNIDATPGSMNAFKKLRPRDINLEVAVSKSKVPMDFFIFNDPALNTFSQELASQRAKIPGYHIIETRKILTAPLSEILEANMANQTEIDFLSIDVEGLDQEVVESNDWSRFRPKVLITESLETNLSNYMSSDLKKSMETLGYELFAKTFHSMFFIDSNKKGMLGD